MAQFIYIVYTRCIPDKKIHEHKKFENLSLYVYFLTAKGCISASVNGTIDSVAPW